MSASLLSALLERELSLAKSDLDTLDILVGTEKKKFSVPVAHLPPESFLGSMARQRHNFSERTPELPECDPYFVELLCVFLAQRAHFYSLEVTAYSEYKVTFSSWEDSFAPGFIEEGRRVV